MNHDKYNDLPRETKEICYREIVYMQIGQLKRDREKIVRHHAALLKEIDAHIKSCEKALK